VSFGHDNDTASLIRNRLNIGVLGLLAFGGLSVLAATNGLWKLLGISWVGFLAMAVGGPLGARSAETNHPLEPVWGYGLASGAMVTSAAVFLVPQAISQHPALGGFGIAFGLLGGYVGHTVGHRLAHRDWSLDHTAGALTAHALSAGAILGVIYAAMPSLSSILGLALVSHKGPAGYAAARKLVDAGRPVSVLLLPATAVGLAALPMGLLDVSLGPVVRALVFGFGAGMFLHVATDLLPECTGGNDACVAESGDIHALHDRFRIHAALSTVVGALVVFGAWVLVATP
jgi:ZIP family zinc transporter